MTENRHRREALILLIIAFAVNSLIVYGFLSRSEIAYHISTNLGYNETIDLASNELPIILNARNVGGSPAWIDFVVRLYNASLKTPEDVEIKVLEEVTIIKIPLTESLSPGENINMMIEITSDGKSSYAVMIFSLERRKNWIPASEFFNSFSVFKPERPTALLLQRLDKLLYKRVTKR